MYQDGMILEDFHYLKSSYLFKSENIVVLKQSRRLFCCCTFPEWQNRKLIPFKFSFRENFWDMLRLEIWI